MPPLPPAVIRLIVPAQSARPGPPLSPVLGQHAVKVADFVAEFNRATAAFAPGVPLGVRLTKVGTKFTFVVAAPSVTVRLRGAVRAGRLGRAALWDAAGRTPRGVRTLLGTLRSTRWVPE